MYKGYDPDYEPQYNLVHTNPKKQLKFKEIDTISARHLVNQTEISAMRFKQKYDPKNQLRQLVVITPAVEIRDNTYVIDSSDYKPP